MTDLPLLTAPAAVTFVGAGPGAAAHLTLGAYRALQEADVVIHDRLVGAEILALIPRHRPPHRHGQRGVWPLDRPVRHQRHAGRQALTGARVVRLKGGDCGIFGRLDEEIEALEAAGPDLHHPARPDLGCGRCGQIGQSLTRRGRNAALRIVTGHDMDGFRRTGLARRWPGPVR